jgi:von Willebrand factor type D domain
VSALRLIPRLALIAVAVAAGLAAAGRPAAAFTGAPRPAAAFAGAPRPGLAPAEPAEPAGAPRLAPAPAPTPSPSTAIDGAPTEVPGLRLTVRATNPVAPEVVLTNGGQHACKVASTALGTLTISTVEQDGAVVAPIFFDAAFTDGLDQAIAVRLRSLQPGEAVRFPVPVRAIGPTGHALETIALSAAGPIGALYPVTVDHPLRIQASYRVPVLVGTGQTLCSAATATGDGDGGASRPWWIPWAIGAGGVLVLLALVGFFGYLPRRPRRRASRSVAAGVLALLVGAVGLAEDGRARAYADVSVDPVLTGAWDSCSTTFHSPGGDPAEILPTLEEHGTSVRIMTANGDVTHEGAIGPDQIFIFWDIDDHHKYVGSGGEADPCTSLYHEMYHAWEDATGGQDRATCVGPDGPSPLPVNEVNATRAQNQLRTLLGLGERDHYGPYKLPDYCIPPAQQPAATDVCGAGGRCAASTGDPHLSTFDGRRYDFQAVGEFVAVRDRSGGLAVQVRQAPWPGSRRVAVNTAVAMDVAGVRVQVTMVRGRPVLLVAGAVRPVAGTSLPSGGSVQVGAAPLGTAITVTWPDGSKATVDTIGEFGLRLTVGVAKARAGRLEGLMGNFDGDPDNDVRVGGGPPIVEPGYADLYPALANSWRVTDTSSLFSYDAGTSTQTFTDRTFPDRDSPAESVPNRVAFEALCRRLGVTDPVLIAACVVDVGLTGEPDFGLALSATQAVTAGTLDGTESVLRIAKPGGTASVTFNGTRGQVVFVDVPATTLPSECGALQLRDPAGKQLNSGCLINGEGYLDRTQLPVTGRYTVVVAPRAKGTLWLKVLTTADQTGPIADDAEVKVSLRVPGSQAKLTFSALAGETVFVDVPASSLDNQCSPVQVRGPSNQLINSGCVIGGRGYVDRSFLPVTGEYSVLVDPAAGGIGDARVRLYRVSDQTGTVTANGDEVIATLAVPGSQARFMFIGTAGQRISVEATSSTLPGQCSPLVLLGPDGTPVATGCVVLGRGEIRQVTLRASGGYSLMVDPTADTTGVTHVRLRSP